MPDVTAVILRLRSVWISKRTVILHCLSCSFKESWTQQDYSHFIPMKLTKWDKFQIPAITITWIFLLHLLSLLWILLLSPTGQWQRTLQVWWEGSGMCMSEELVSVTSREKWKETSNHRARIPNMTSEVTYLSSPEYPKGGSVVEDNSAP